MHACVTCTLRCISSPAAGVTDGCEAAIARAGLSIWVFCILFTSLLCGHSCLFLLPLILKKSVLSLLGLSYSLLCPLNIALIVPFTSFSENMVQACFAHLLPLKRNQPFLRSLHPMHHGTDFQNLIQEPVNILHELANYDS